MKLIVSMSEPMATITFILNLCFEGGDHVVWLVTHSLIFIWESHAKNKFA